MRKIFLILLICLFVFSCSKENTKTSVCPNNDCWVKLYTDFEEDSNGYHHVTPQWYSESSGRFNLHVESISTSPRCQSNSVSFITSKFDSDTYWEVERGLSFTFGLYNPFESLYTQKEIL